ncbi:MAG: PPC domain-containing protein [Clostridia bacterium]|nr:PPC domain-containing protein [Clostridia bacterium]
MKKRQILILVLVVLALAAAVVLVLRNRESEFTGNRVKNPDAYLLDIQQMNGTDSHALALKKGDVLAVMFETTGGRLTMEITAPDGSAIYQGNGTAEATEFTLGVPEDGTYTISVRAEKAKGTIHVRLSDAGAEE